MRIGLADQPGLAALADQLDRIAQGNNREHFDRLREKRPGDDRTDLDLVGSHDDLCSGRSSPDNAAVYCE